MRLLKTSCRNFVSCFILLLLLQTNVQSQSQDNKIWWQKHWFIGVSGGPAQTDISTTGTPVITGVVTTKGTSYSLSVDAGYYFSKYFGFTTGIGLSPYINQLSLDSYSNTLDTVDSENESYERRISGNNYSSSGTFSYTGYYPAYNVVFEDIPYEGFKSNVKNDVSGELKVKTLNPELIASGGFYFHNQKQFQISAGFFYKSLFSDISDYTPAGSYQLSTHEDQLRSLMEGSQKTTASSIGILVSLRYYLK
jgi:hypothetical protein